MKKFIYYPGFEVRHRNWLKFSLLYLEKLCPIIPPSGDPYLTELHRKLENETDLLSIHRPDYHEGERATFDAIDQVEKILRHPDRYESIFNNPNVIELWRDPGQQRFTLFEEKYTEVWKSFCFNNGLAKQSPQGMVIPRELGLIYMTLLAQSIADLEGVSPITDYPNLDKFSIITHRVDPIKEDTISAAQSVFKLKLPENLSEISVDEIINHRNRPQFKRRLHAFHIALNDFLNSVEEGLEAEDFVRSLGNAWSDFGSEIIQIGTGAASFGLGVWLLLQAPEIATAAYLKDIMGGAGLVFGSTLAIKSTWTRTRTMRLARRYLTDLTELKPATLA
jgi:hypothetical protein